MLGGRSLRNVTDWACRSVPQPSRQSTIGKPPAPDAALSSSRTCLCTGAGTPTAGGRAVRALAVTARATAALVAAGSARMTTRAPVVVFAVSLGAIQMIRQPEAARRVMSFCPSACWVPL